MAVSGGFPSVTLFQIGSGSPSVTLFRIGPGSPSVTLFQGSINYTVFGSDRIGIGAATDVADVSRQGKDSCPLLAEVPSRRLRFQSRRRVGQIR